MMQEIDKLLSKHIGLVYTNLRRMYLLHDQDAESIAYDALHKALVDFDPERGLKPSTLATVYITNALGTYLRTLKKQRQLDVMSYNNSAYEDDSGSHEFLEFIAGPETAESAILKQELYEQVNIAYEWALGRLATARHRDIVEMWHDSDYTMQMKEIAKAIGISQPAVSQVINTFKFTLKKKLEGYYCD